mmetsp:Transcript_12310/g.23353  ORF Transcript_12310/g.23353 Transcript_12310/m.23353 type:complete len:205 (-) Transcript_12310:695-1309(-)
MSVAVAPLLSQSRQPEEAFLLLRHRLRVEDVGQRHAHHGWLRGVGGTAASAELAQPHARRASQALELLAQSLVRAGGGCALRAGARVALPSAPVLPAPTTAALLPYRFLHLRRRLSFRLHHRDLAALDVGRHWGRRGHGRGACGLSHGPSLAPGLVVADAVKLGSHLSLLLLSRLFESVFFVFPLPHEIVIGPVFAFSASRRMI